MKQLILLASFIIVISSCSKDAEEKPEPVILKSTYTVSATAGPIPMGTVQAYTVTGPDIQPVTVTNTSTIFSAELPKGKSTTITLTGTVGNPWLRVMVYKTNILSAQNLVADKSANNSVSVTFTVE